MKKLLFFLLLASATQNAMGQTATGSFTQVPCNNDGVFSVTTSGIPLPITYTYYTGTSTIVHANVNSATDQITNVAMSNYSYIYCEVTGGGLTAYAQDDYSPAFIFEVFGSSPTCPATMGTINASYINGTPGPFTFSWTNTQSLISYSGNNASVPLGSYSGEITDQTTGCVLQVQDSSVTIYQLSGITASISNTPASCTNGTATAVASGGTAPYSYAWSNGVNGPSNTGLSQGYYSLLVTDAQGCQSNGLGQYIQQNPQIFVGVTPTYATCTENDGSAMAFGSGGQNPYTYIWSNGQTGNTATNLSGNTSYSVIATDANGCVGQANAYISSSTPINVTYTSSPSQCVSPTGSATLTPSGGTLPYTYTWASYPSVTGPVLSNIPPGNYFFTVTDAVGCVRSGSVQVAPVSTINASLYSSAVVCPAVTGNVSAVVTGTNGPFTYLWSNNATTSVLSGVPLGGYSCVITDALGCSVTKYRSVTSVSPVNVGVSATPVTCLYNNDGAASSNVSGGTSPYSYSYTSGATTANATGLGTGGYYLTVTDADGCSTSKYFSVANANTSDNCYCTISGTVFVDGNANCTNDSGENGVENIMIHCSGFGYTFTDEDGHYSFRVPTGTYTITEQVNQYYPLSPCQSNGSSVSVIAASGCNNVVDFSNNVVELHDLKIVTMNATIPPIPGNSYLQKVIVQNAGTITESGIQLGYEHDSQIPFVSSSSPDFVQLNSVLSPYAYNIQSNFPSLDPGDDEVLMVSYSTPTTIPLGTSVLFYDTVANVAPIDVNWLLDNTPWNNVNIFQANVIGSYDPNYKEVTPAGEGAAGYVPLDTKEFDYTIHFQNEGTYFAQNISVTDQLDEDFDWTTFKPGYSDYEYSTTMSETGLVTFTFANINLPWKSTYGDVLSSGLVNYSIQRKTTTPVGTEFTNSASIYFDYNAPVITNTTLNTLTESLGIEDVSTSGDAVNVELFPVPTSDQLTIRINNVSQSGTANVSIVDLTGKVVMSEKISLSKGSTAVTKDLSALRTGTYLTRIEFENGSSIVKKIVVSNN